MKELETLALRTGMTIPELKLAFKQLKAFKAPRNYSPKSLWNPKVQFAFDCFDWDADRDLWRWTTSREVFSDLGLSPSEGDVRQLTAVCLREKGIERKRTNGKNLIRMPPQIQNRD